MRTARSPTIHASQRTSFNMSGGGVLYSEVQVPFLPVNRQTHTAENITCTQLYWWPVSHSHTKSNWFWPHRVEVHHRPVQGSGDQFCQCAQQDGKTTYKLPITDFQGRSTSIRKSPQWPSINTFCHEWSFVVKGESPYHCFRANRGKSDIKIYSSTLIPKFPMLT